MIENNNHKKFVQNIITPISKFAIKMKKIILNRTHSLFLLTSATTFRSLATFFLKFEICSGKFSSFLYTQTLFFKFLIFKKNFDKCVLRYSHQ